MAYQQILHIQTGGRGTADVTARMAEVVRASGIAVGSWPGCAPNPLFRREWAACFPRRLPEASHFRSLLLQIVRLTHHQIKVAGIVAVPLTRLP